MKQRVMYTEKQPDVRYQKLNETKADVIVNQFVGEEQMIVDLEQKLTQTMYVYMSNTFSVNPSVVTENDVKNKLSYYMNYEEEKEKTINEKVADLEVKNQSLEQANAELSTTVDSILTEIIPSIMGV